MYIKSINNVVGYKDLPDGFNADFSQDKTYIIGANFQRKSTVGSLFNWCLTGTSLYGNEKEQVANDKIKVSNVSVDITFVDNYGIEHRLIRDKGKQMNLILDDKEIKQEMLAEFYKDKDIFLVAHNPYYFASLEPKEQKELVRRIIPGISKEESFNLLTDEEKEIIGVPIEHLGSYTDKRNEEINELQKEYDENLGKLQAYKNMALEQVDDILTFDKEEELKKLQERYEDISMNIGNSNLEDIQHAIKRINERLDDILKDKLAEITKNYNSENEKLKNVDNEVPICSTCRQEIKDSEVKMHLKQFYQKELNKLQENANKLKEDAKQLVDARKEKQDILEKLNTLDVQEIQKEKEELKTNIDILQKEKNDILLHNKEVEIRQEQIRKSKENIKLLENAKQEIADELNRAKIQKEIANKLKRLVIEEQRQKINKFLDKVDIQFCRENKTNDKITECCDIFYEGREFKKLSKSQQARTCLEISNLFNNLSGIKAPIFLDDAESITDIEEIINTQMIISLVIKYNPLEILYDYSDVLDRRKKSVEREIRENSSFVIQQAA